MNVYDFDKTIFAQDSTVAFYFFEIRRHPALLRYAPRQLVGFAGYFLHVHDITETKKYFYRFLKGIDNIDEEVKLFWDKHINGIHEWYLKQKRDDDLIISASSEFLVREAMNRLGIKQVIGSLVDKKSGEVLSPNCSRGEKVVRMKAAGYNVNDIEEFYSDSLKDLPMAKLAKKSYMVVKGKPEPWPNL